MIHGSPFEVSIVVPCHNEGQKLHQTLEALRESTKVSYEVIVVNDDSTDSCCDFVRDEPPSFGNVTLVDLPRRKGVAVARNVGAAQAKAPVLVTMDGHCIPRPGWLERLLDELHQPGVGIVAPKISSAGTPGAMAFGLTIRGLELGVEWLNQQASEPYPVPLAGCACLVMKRELFEATGGFEEMRSYGMEDFELCLRVWLLGYSVMMVPTAEVAHWFKKVPFAVGWHDYLYNRLRTAVLHFDGDPLARILACLQAKPAFRDAMASLLASDIFARREFVRRHRKYDADWFCRKFEIAL